jgi:predicted nicotinamide N-methyase
LASYLGLHANLVAHKTILDFGCGGGMAGIAAKKAGALAVTGNDIDASALIMATRNAIANKVTMDFNQDNLLLSTPNKAIEIILVGDMFYDRKISEVMILWLNQARQQGTKVYIADASRPFAPKVDVTLLHEEQYQTNFDLEGRSERTVKLLAYRP